jgi:HlyD family secretion protein
VARNTERALRAVYDQAEAGYRQEDKLAAAAQYRAAEEHVAEVQALVDELTLVAPINGEIVDRIVEPGELVSPGFPIVSLVDLQDVWVTFNLREDLLARVRMGSIFTVRIPALGNKDIKFKVNYISARGDFATWRATRASGDFDLKTFEVRGVPIEPVEGLRPGMSALVTKKTSD